MESAVDMLPRVCLGRFNLVSEQTFDPKITTINGSSDIRVREGGLQQGSNCFQIKEYFLVLGLVQELALWRYTING